MKTKRFTRRELLQRSGTLGVIALTGGVAVGMSGCRLRENPSLRDRKWREVSAPAPAGSVSPRVTWQPDKSVVLSWLEPMADRKAALRLAKWKGAGWSEPATIASGLAFSRDQAASPGVVGLSRTNLIAYWSERVTTRKSAEEIALSVAVSTDGGDHWGAPVQVNRAAPPPGEDNVYASAVGLDDQRAQIIWLDGSAWEKSKRMQLMSRVVSLAEPMSEVQLLDADTCTCCSTSIVRTGSRLLAAYRGHTSENIRDIKVVRNVDSNWLAPSVPHADHWHIEACPVNGPHLDAAENRTALIWFTAPQDQPAVKLAFSSDGGARYAGALRLDTGRAVGRAQVTLLSDGSAVGFWLESESGTARLIARRVRDDGRMSAPLELARGTNFAFPHAARTEKGVLVAWSEKNAGSEIHAGLLETD